LSSAWAYVHTQVREVVTPLLDMAPPSLGGGLHEGAYNAAQLAKLVRAGKRR